MQARAVNPRPRALVPEKPGVILLSCTVLIFSGVLGVAHMDTSEPSPVSTFLTSLPTIPLTAEFSPVLPTGHYRSRLRFCVGDNNAKNDPRLHRNLLYNSCRARNDCGKWGHAILTQKAPSCQQAARHWVSIYGICLQLPIVHLTDNQKA